MNEVQIEGFYLSPQQRKIWSLHREDGPGAFIARMTVRIHGLLDLDAFERAIEDVYLRNEILRVSLTGAQELEVPLQSPVESVPEPLRTFDLSGLSSSEAKDRCDQIENDLRQRLRLSDLPLVRMSLASLSSDDHILWVAAPSLCSDAKGLDNLVAVIADYYERRLSNDAPDDTPLQYVDASAWLNEVLDSQETRAGAAFWTGHDLLSLRDVKLPFERADQAAEFRPRRLPLDVPAGIAAASASLGASPESLLMTCWQWYLSRLVDDDGLLVSEVCPIRDYDELALALGVFARQLPSSGDITGSLSLRDAARRLEEIRSQSRQWGLCFDRSRYGDQAVGPRLDYAPYVFEALQWPEPRTVGSTRFETVERSAIIDRFKLKLTYEVDEHATRAALEFDAAIYREDDVARCARGLETLVTDAIARPDADLAALELVPESERRWLLRTETDSFAGAAESHCVHELIVRAAQVDPTRAAIVSGEDTISYERLDRDSNRLAHRLIAMGARPDSLVAVCLERAPEAIVVMLAILKAGAAYVPLDLKVPGTRRSRMIADCGADILVYRQELACEGLPGHVQTLRLDEDAIGGSQKDDPVNVNVAGDNLAYVLFTSGSTGRPKGVAIEHRQLVSYTRAVSKRFDLPRESTYASVTTLSADLGNTAIFTALCTGGTLDLVPDDCVTDPAAFSEYASRHRIDVLKIVPSHLEMLLTSARPADVLPKSLLVLGGEACTWELVDRVHRHAPSLDVINHYGPTETTVGVTTHRVSETPVTPQARTVPIGRPLDGVRAYVLDGRRALAPVWAPGELYIGGATVARGYVHPTETERQRFLADPFSHVEGARMYRTGDIARVLPTGDLEFLGRADNQVKIRGYRVELGEVEARLKTHPGLADAAAAFQQSTGNDPRLVAYVVPRGAERADAKELRAYVADELPDYMVPAVIVTLDALPLSSNGKLDRKALPDPPSQHADAADRDTSEEELSNWELVIRELWSELLQTDDVHVDDNFYDLGGHSLLAIRVVTELEKRTELHVSPRELVFHTLRQFAAICESKKAEPGVPPATENSRES